MIHFLIAYVVALGASSSHVPQGTEGPRLPPLADDWGLLSPSGRRLALPGQTASVILVGIQESRLLAHLFPVDTEAEALEAVTLVDMAWSIDEKRLAALLSTGRVVVIDIAEGIPVGSFAAHSAGEEHVSRPERLTFVADNNLAIWGPGSVMVRSVEEEQVVAEMASLQEGAITVLVASNDGYRVAMGDDKGTVSVWDIRQGNADSGKAIDVGACVTALDFHPSEPLVAIGTDNCLVWLWNFRTSEKLRNLSHCDDVVTSGPEVGCVAFNPKGDRLVSTSTRFGWEARAWRVDDGNLLWKYQYDGGNPGFMVAEYTGDGERVVLGVEGVILDAESGSVLHTLVQAAGPGARAWFSISGVAAWRINECQLDVFSLEGGYDQLMSVPVEIKRP